MTAVVLWAGPRDGEQLDVDSDDLADLLRFAFISAPSSATMPRGVLDLEELDLPAGVSHHAYELSLADSLTDPHDRLVYFYVGTYPA